MNEDNSAMNNNNKSPTIVGPTHSTNEPYFFGPKSEYLLVPEVSSFANPTPSCLSVPDPWNLCCSSLSGGSRRASSTVSSIFDLSFEAETLERAIRDDDVNVVKKFLELHHNKFSVNLHDSILDKSETDSRSRNISNVTQDVEILLRKSQTLLERYNDRRESFTTESDVPAIFPNALPVAIELNAENVVKLLLRYGVDPNIAGVNPIPHPPNSRRPSSISDIYQQNSNHREGSSTNKKDVKFLFPSQSIEADDQPAISSERSPLREHTLKINSNVGLEAGRVGGEAGLESTSSASGTAMSAGTAATTSKTFDFAVAYIPEKLVQLPPLFVAVTSKNPLYTRLLLKYGAKPNFSDHNGNTALHLAVSVEFQNWENALCLLQNGAKIHCKNRCGLTPHDLSPDLCKEQTTIIQAVYEQVSLRQGSNANNDVPGGSQDNGHHRNKSKRFRRLSPGHESRSRSKEKKREREISDKISGARERTPSGSSSKSGRSGRSLSATTSGQSEKLSTIINIPDLLDMETSTTTTSSEKEKEKVG